MVLSKLLIEFLKDLYFVVFCPSRLLLTKFQPIHSIFIADLTALRKRRNFKFYHMALKTLTAIDNKFILHELSIFSNILNKSR